MSPEEVLRAVSSPCAKQGKGERTFDYRRAVSGDVSAAGDDVVASLSIAMAHMRQAGVLRETGATVRTGNGMLVAELTVRDPEAADLIRAGAPVHASDDESLTDGTGPDKDSRMTTAARNPKDWTPGELRRLDAMVAAGSTMAEMLADLPGRSERAIDQKRLKIGRRKTPARVPYAAEDDDLIRAAHATGGRLGVKAAFAARGSTRTYASLTARIKALGLEGPSYNRGRNAHLIVLDNQIKRLLPTMPVEEIAAELKQPVKRIRRRMFEMGLTRRRPH